MEEQKGISPNSQVESTLDKAELALRQQTQLANLSVLVRSYGDNPNGSTDQESIAERIN